MSRAASARRVVQRLLLAIGCACLGAFALARLAAWGWSEREATSFAALLGKGAGGGPFPGAPGGGARAAAQPGRAWGRIDLPRAGVSALIVEGVDDTTLWVAIGHVPGSAFPGEPGNVALAGHRDTLFRGLRKAALGDVVRVTTPDGVFAYQIEALTVVDPERVEVLAPTSEPVLTLVTCYPFAYVGRAPLRYVVRARRYSGPVLAGLSG